jgi:hypothetical protein
MLFANKSDNRKQLLINPDFQLSFIKLTAGVSGVVVLLFYGAIRYFFWTFHSKAQESGLPDTHPLYQFLDQQLGTMNAIFAFTAAVSIAVLVFFGLHMSNRVAGPLHRLKIYLTVQKTGNTQEPLKFRKDDYFQDVADVVNQNR